MSRVRSLLKRFLTEVEEGLNALTGFSVIGKTYKIIDSLLSLFVIVKASKIFLLMNLISSIHFQCKRNRPCQRILILSLPVNRGR